MAPSTRVTAHFSDGWVRAVPTEGVGTNQFFDAVFGFPMGLFNSDILRHSSRIARSQTAQNTAEGRFQFVVDGDIS